MGEDVCRLVCAKYLNLLAKTSNQMSTKTSNDMHVGRSTTRRHAPPGGVSTFSVAWEENPKDSKPAAEPEVEEGLIPLHLDLFSSSSCFPHSI